MKHTFIVLDPKEWEKTKTEEPLDYSNLKLSITDLNKQIDKIIEKIKSKRVQK